MFAGLSAHAALAQAEDVVCNSIPKSLDDVAVMRVTGQGPAHFFEDAWACRPAAAPCPKRAYVLPGDQVFAQPRGTGFSCAWYIDRKGRETWGLLKRDRLAPGVDARAAETGLSTWAGDWRPVAISIPHFERGDDLSSTIEIAIIVDGAQLKATGDATFPYHDGTGELSAYLGSFGEPDQGLDYLSAPNVKRYGVAASPSQGRVTFADDCRLQMRRIGDVLLVIDTGDCVGGGRSFSDFYVRRGPVSTGTAAKRGKS